MPRGPDWMPITPKTGSLFHAETHNRRLVACDEPLDLGERLPRRLLRQEMPAVDRASLTLLRGGPINRAAPSAGFVYQNPMADILFAKDFGCPAIHDSSGLCDLRT